jgi:hypothetical protein
MALNTLKGVTEIGGYPVIVMDELREKFPHKFNESGSMDYKWFEEEIRPNYFVYVRHDVNSISFTLQSAPIGEVGVNGCQVDTLIDAARLILVGLNKEERSKYTELAINKLEMALHWLGERTKNRQQRGVEGTSKE